MAVIEIMESETGGYVCRDTSCHRPLELGNHSNPGSPSSPSSPSIPSNAVKPDKPTSHHANNVNKFHNSHYKNNDIDVIEALALNQGKERLIGFLIGNIWKYAARSTEKGTPSADCDKIQYYQDILRQVCENFDLYKAGIVDKICARLNHDKQ